MKRKFKILARHKWLVNTTITESYDINNEAYRRYTATICGYTNWRIYEGFCNDNKKRVDFIINKVKEIRNKIESGDKSVFYESNKFTTELK